MFIYLLSFSMLVGLLVHPIFFSGGKRRAKKIRIPKKIRVPKNHSDTSNANYAINENGFLERIHRDKLSRHSG